MGWGVRRKYSNLLASLENTYGWFSFFFTYLTLFSYQCTTLCDKGKFSHRHLLVTRALQTADPRSLLGLLPGRRSWDRAVWEVPCTGEPKGACSWQPSAYRIVRSGQDPREFSITHLKPGAGPKGATPPLCLSGARPRIGPPLAQAHLLPTAPSSLWMNCWAPPPAARLCLCLQSYMYHRKANWWSICIMESREISVFSLYS